jgi:hypothetical protein
MKFIKYIILLYSSLGKFDMSNECIVVLIMFSHTDGRGSIPDWSNNFVLHIFQTFSGAHSAFYPVVNGEDFLWTKAPKVWN